MSPSNQYSVCDEESTFALQPSVVGDKLESLDNAQANRPKVFDRAHALKRLGGLDEVLLEIMELMTTESRRTFDQMHEMHVHQDADGLKRAAHTLKGAASIIGAQDLVSRLKRVEDFAATSDFNNAANEFPEIDRQFAELQQRLVLELASQS